MLKKKIADDLQTIGISLHEAHAEAQVIARFVTALPAAQQVLFEEEISEHWQNQVRAIVEQRCKRIPLQYILGECQFMDLTLKVEPGVFIPRSDTETLVIAALNILAEEMSSKPRIVDVGCGSGAIAISLAHAVDDAEICAIDISGIALQVAEGNAGMHNVLERIKFVEGDWRMVMPEDVHLVVCNPPYISPSKMNQLQPEVRNYEPPIALFPADEDGLTHYRQLAEIAPEHFEKGCGHICLEIGDGQAEAVAEIFLASGWLNVKTVLDLNGVPRVISAHRSENDVKKR
jgi:release factor glutamine methyltransferase